MSLLIRAYDPSRDADRVRQLLIELHEYERSLEPSLPESEKMAEPYLVLLLERCKKWAGHILVAVDHDSVAGLVVVLTKVPPEEPDEVQHEHAYITDLVVLPRCRGVGLGRSLLEHAEALARKSGARILRIDVLAKNSKAHDLYEQFSFQDFTIQMVKQL